MHGRTGLLYKEESKAFTWVTYLNPFEKYTWIMIGISSVVCGIFYFITAQFGKIIDEDDEFDLPLSFMIIIHSMFNQGAPYEPKKASTR